MLPTLVLKIIVLFTLLIGTFTFSMLPLCALRLTRRRQFSSERRHSFKAAVSVLSCFAAGVFIGVCLLDLFPEVEEKLQNVLKSPEINSSFPLPEFIVVVGFLLLLFVEQFVITWKARTPITEEMGPLFADCDSMSSSYSSIGPPHPAVRVARSSGFTSNDRLTEVSDAMAALDNMSVIEEDEVNNVQVYDDPSAHSVMRSLILIIALSLHSLFEGLAVGLQPNMNDTLRLFVALALHKCVLAFSLGLNMVQSRLRLRSVIISNISFSLASPIGIAIGIGVVDTWQNGMAANAIIGTLQGLACGTFLYVVFIEILPHEFLKKRAELKPDRLLKVLFLIIGFSVVVAFMLLDPDA